MSSGLVIVETVPLVTLMTDAGVLVGTKTSGIWDGKMERGTLLN